MPGTFLRTGYTNLQTMVSDIVTDIKASGFTLLNAYNNTAAGEPIFGANSAPAHSVTTGFYVLAATKDVDPLALDEGEESDPNYQQRQPWRLVIQVADVQGTGASDIAKNKDFIRIWVCHKTQVITELSGEVKVANYAADRQSGYLYNNNVSNVTTKKTAFFARKHVDIITKSWTCFATPLADQESVPMSYQLSITDHGIAFSSWAENYDKAGDCFNWFVVQRLIKDDGSILIDQKSPLMCVFSQTGGGAPDGDTVVSDGIQYFVVCEEDIAAPTAPLSAVALTPDSVPFINPMQQVGVMTDRNYVMHFPKGICTQRHYYPYRLDMIAYASADIISHKSLHSFTSLGEGRQYRALNANSLNNKGMRVLAIIQGAGIV